MSIVNPTRKVTRNLAEVEPLLDNEPLANSYYQIIVYARGYT